MTTISNDFQPPLAFFQTCDIDTHVLLSSTLRFSHTFKLYDRLFAQAGRKARLVPFELALETTEDRDTLFDLLMAFRENGYIKSMMVSNPFKEQIIPYVDGIDRISQRAGAVNLILKHKMILTGVNIDGEAFLQAMEKEGVDVKEKRVCFLGCGGVSAAVSTAIAADCTSIALIDIDPEKCAKLKTRLDQLISPDAVQILPSSGVRDLSLFDIIYNGTGLGKQGQADSDLLASPLNEADLLPADGTAIDAVYTPERTEFLTQCHKSGIRIINGLSHMLACTSIHLGATTDMPVTYEQVAQAHQELFHPQ